MPLLPAKIRINPRTGKVQVFVSPKVAAQVKGGNRRGNPSATYYLAIATIGTATVGSDSLLTEYKSDAIKMAKDLAKKTGGKVVLYKNKTQLGTYGKK